MKGGLHNIWLRVLVCAVAGGASQELLHITTGDPNRPEAGNFSLLFGFGFFILVTAVLRYRKKPSQNGAAIDNIGKD